LSLSLPSHELARAAQQPRFEAFGLSDVGRVRETNEDCFAVHPHLGLFLVADGLGGHASGEVASRMAVESVREVFEDPDATWPRGLDAPCRLPGPSALVAGVELANARIFTAAARERSSRGMGTTLVGALAWGERIVFAHVGDSRAYRLRGPTLDLLTEDHSLVNDRVRAGLLTPEQARTSPFQNVITRCVGARAEVEVEIQIDLPRAGDVYLLCSDGLSGVIEHRELTAILLEHRDLCRTVARLVERANELGGPDNITAVLLRVSDPTR